MAYNTRNPLGSKDPRDLYDNATNLDHLVNGPELTWADRFGVQRKSYAGIEKDYADFLANQGFEADALDYGAGVVLQRPTQLVIREGEFYRAGPTADLPLTLSGNWATDSQYLVGVGDAALRSQLALPDGADRIGYVRDGRTVDDRLRESPSLRDFSSAQAAVDAIEPRGEILVPPGQYPQPSATDNVLGVRFVGEGSIMVPAQVPADGYRQENTYADDNQTGTGLTHIKRPYDYFAVGQGAPGGTLRINLYGDSTVIGGNGETGNFNPKTLIERAFSAKGVPNVFVTNRAIGGSQISAHVAQAVSDLQSNPGLYILKSFINEGTQDLATRFSQTQAQLENFLSQVRAGSGGAEEFLSIVVMGPNGTNNTRYQRDVFWYEQLRDMIVATCKRYRAVYFDTYRIFQDVLRSSEIGYMDRPYADRPLDAIHPLDAMQSQIWGRLLQWLLPDETLYPYRTNSFTNHGAVSFSFSNSQAPSDFQVGQHFYRAPTSAGAPIDGFVRVTKNVDGGILQELFPYVANDSRVLTRTANLATNSWNPWSGQTIGPEGLTFQNGWQDYNDGNAVTSASFVVTSEGYVELYGMIKGGTVADGTVVAILPPGYRPLTPENGISYSGSSQGFATWAITPDGRISGAKGLSASGTSLAGIKFRRGN